jgi:radical SAM protein with 4Fe4S-binding SPASM domain
MAQKHCSRLWNSLVIRHTGRVYPCCQLEMTDANAIGNILTDSLDDIINGPKIQSMRQQSLEERLPCYENCEQVKTFEAYPIPKPDNVRSSPEAYVDLQIEYGELCNVDCVMCWQDRTNNKVIPYEILKSKIPLESWKMITVYGGEVFVMKDAMKHIHDILELGYRNLTIITNGRALSNEALAEKIVRSAYSLIVSINAATEPTHTHVMRPKEPYFDQLIRSIQRLQVFKRNHSRFDFRINANFCGLIESMHEIPMAIEKFKDFGFDTLSVTFDHRHFPAFFHENPEKMKALAEKIDESLHNVGPETSKWVKVADYGLFGLTAPHGHP